MLSGIHEVWATDGGNKSPQCEVSDRLLATLEKFKTTLVVILARGADRDVGTRG